MVKPGVRFRWKVILRWTWLWSKSNQFKWAARQRLHCGNPAILSNRLEPGGLFTFSPTALLLLLRLENNISDYIVHWEAGAQSEMGTFCLRLNWPGFRELTGIRPFPICLLVFKMLFSNELVNDNIYPFCFCMWLSKISIIAIFPQTGIFCDIFQTVIISTLQRLFLFLRFADLRLSVLLVCPSYWQGEEKSKKTDLLPKMFPLPD